MADVNNNDVIIVTADIITHGQHTENVFAFKARVSAGIGASAALNSVRNRMRDIYGMVAAYMWIGCNFYALYARNKTTGQDLGTTTWDTTGWAGHSTGDPLPLGVAGLMTFPTTSGKVRGRKFLPGLTENHCTDSLWTSGMVGGMLNMGAAILLIDVIPSGGAALDYVIVTEGVGAFTTRYPTSVSVSEVPAYQRRRKQGVGR